MKIKSIETFSTPDVALTRVCTDDGARGWGQVSPYNADISAEVLHRQVAPHALGRAADELSHLPALCDDIFAAEHKFPGSYLCRAVAGLETALWDMHGKLRRLPVCALLGGEARPLRVYASGMRRDIAPADEAARFAALRERYGFDAFKFRIGRECGGDKDEWPQRTETIVPAVRRALGDDVALLVDANSAYTPAKAIQIGRMLDEYGVCHYEEPCPYWRPEWTRRVTAAGLNCEITGGEQDNNMALWQYMLQNRVMDVAQPDVCYVGGVSRFLRVAEMARREGMKVTPHSANLSLVTVFTLHIMAALENAGPYVEFSIEDESYYPWQYGIYEPMPAVKDGMAEVPAAPGWGVDIRDDWLRRAVYQISEL